MQHTKIHLKKIYHCTDEELWRSDPQYKYYTDPTKTSGRSTNFDNLADAHRHLAEKGGKGVIITKPGEPKACAYCPAFLTPAHKRICISHD